MAGRNASSFGLVFGLIFFGFVAYMMFTSINNFMDDDFGSAWFIYAFLILFFVIITAPIVMMIISIRKKRHPAAGTAYNAADPMMYDNRGTAAGYCRYCGANTGVSHPKFCPECGKNLRY